MRAKHGPPRPQAIDLVRDEAWFRLVLVGLIACRWAERSETMELREVNVERQRK